MARLYASMSIVGSRPGALPWLRRQLGPMVSGVELGLFPDETRLGQAIAYCRQHHLAVSFHHPVVRAPGIGSESYKQVTAHPPAQRALALALVEQSLTLVARSGVPGHLVVHAPSQLLPGSDLPVRREYEAGVDHSLETLCRLSLRYGVEIHLESDGPNPFYRRPQAIAAYFRPWPHLGHCLDVMHLAVLCGKYAYEGTFEEWVACLAPFTRSVHLANTISPLGRGEDAHIRQGGRGPHLRMPVHPAQAVAAGWADVAGVCRTVQHHNPEAVFVLESIPPRPHELSMMRRHGDRYPAYLRAGSVWAQQLLEAAASPPPHRREGSPVGG